MQIIIRDDDSESSWHISWKWNFISFKCNFTKCNLTKPTHIYDLKSISRSCRPLFLSCGHLAEALGRLWGRSFPTPPQIYRLHRYDLCSEGMLYGSPCGMLNTVSWLYCTDPNLHNHLRELMSKLACEFHPATHGTMKRNYQWNHGMLCWMITWCEIDGSFEGKAEI